MADQITRTLHSVNWNGEKMKIEFSIHGRGEEPDVVLLTSADPPRKEFEAALDGLRKHAGEILDIGDDDWSKNIDIRGAIFAWQHGKMGAKINCVKTLKSGRKFCFLTPYMATGNVDEEEDAIPEQFLTEAAAEALTELITQSLSYIDGDRPQGNLFSFADAA